MIITGTGRCGTKYIHAVLTDLGLDMGNHEKTTGKDGGVLTFRILRTFLRDIHKRDYILQIREPLATVKSSWSSPNLIDYPELRVFSSEYEDKRSFMLFSWHQMNDYLASHAKLTYTLEHLNNGLVSKQLIEIFNLNCSVEEFNDALIRNKTKDALHSRKTNVEKSEIKKSIIYPLCESAYERWSKLP